MYEELKEELSAYVQAKPVEETYADYRKALPIAPTADMRGNQPRRSYTPLTPGLA
jgi:hypothetical protein